MSVPHPIQNQWSLLVDLISFSLPNMRGFFRFLAKSVAAVVLTLFSSNAEVVNPALLDSCPGYTLSNVLVVGGTFRADLNIASGPPCNVFGTDIPRLALLVEYQTGKLRLLHPALIVNATRSFRLQRHASISKSLMQTIPGMKSQTRSSLVLPLQQ